MMRSILTRRGGRDVAQPITARPLERAQREKGTHGARPYRSRILLLVALASLVVLSAVSWHWLADWQRLWGAVQSIFASPAAFHQWVAGFGAWAPVVFFLLVAVQVIVAPIPGSVFPPVAAAAFGPAAGLALITAGTLVGSACVFALTRRWGRPLASKLAGEEALDRYAGLITANGGLWLFLVYLLPLLPDDAVSAIAGLSRISFRRFLLLSTVGRLPGMVLSVYAASQLLASPLWIWLIAILVMVAFMVLLLRYRARVEAWLLRHISGVRARREPRQDEPRQDKRRTDEGAAL
ncbi:MAG TPA: VTT domain-containing protein [Ktedonobacterales bacterium]|nr:VTT domain-containing protein [Ktedonobacterales bacterium]